MRIQLPAVGQSYRHADLPLSAQSTKNWFPEVNTETDTTVSLQPYFGAELVFLTPAVGADRGMTYFQGAILKVTGNKLYAKNLLLDPVTEIGTISGTDYCDFTASSDYLVIVSSGYAYSYDGTTLSTISDVDLESPNSVAYLNNQWIFQGSENRFCVSDAGDPTSINGLNYATAESGGSDLLRVYVFNQLVYLFCRDFIETWWNSGSGNPPFDRVEGGIAQTGCGAPWSIASNDNYIYFIGDDAIVYQMAGSQVRPISTIPVAQTFQAYAEVFTARGFCFTRNGQNFYQVNTDDYTWLFNENSGAWSELTIGAAERQYPVTSHLRVANINFVADGNKVLQLTDTPLYNDELIVRERVTGKISGETLGAEYIGRPIFMSRIEIIIKGVPPLGDAPQIMLSWSDDAGYTWSNERLITCGALGNYTFKAIGWQLGRFYERVFKIRISDEYRCSLHRMSGDIEVGN